MLELTKKKTNENDLTYIWRLCNEKDDGCLFNLSWDNITDIINKELYGDNSKLYKNPDSIRKPYRAAKAYYNDVFSKFNSKSYSVDFEKEERKLKKIKDEVYKEKCKLQDANREKRKFLREESRTETMLEYLKDCISNIPKIKYEKCNYNYGSNLEASLLVSDLHASAQVDNIYNYYDTDVLIERLDQLKNKTIAICKKNCVDYLNIELLGDFITGIIHGSTISESNDDLVSSIINVSEILANFIAEIAKEIPHVTVYSVFGNHDRSTKRKSDSPNRENFGRLVAEFIRLRLPDIKVYDSKYADHLCYQLKDGKLIVLSHGDKDNLSNAMEHFLRLLKKDIYEVHIAHYHSFAEKDGVIVNGSIMGSDDYAIGLRRNTKPTQVLRIYGEDVGCYKLELE